MIQIIQLLTDLRPRTSHPSLCSAWCQSPSRNWCLWIKLKQHKDHKATGVYWYLACGFRDWFPSVLCTLAITCHILPSISGMLGTRTVTFHLSKSTQVGRELQGPDSWMALPSASLHEAKRSKMVKNIKDYQSMLSWAMICAFVQDSHIVKPLAQISSGGGAALTQCQTNACPHTSAAPKTWGSWAAWFVAWARYT